jgi:hypothetical protein
MKAALTLFFLLRAEAAMAGVAELDAAFSEFAVKITLALAILGLLGYAAVKFLPGRLLAGGKGHIKIIGAAGVGRDMLYIVKTGPDVVAFLSGRTGATILGRWGIEEWDDYEAGVSIRETIPPDGKGR